MDEQLKRLRSQLLIFRWVGIGLGLLAFPLPLLLIPVPGGLTTGFALVPVFVIAGLVCMVAGLVTRGKIKSVKAHLRQSASHEGVNEESQDTVTPVAKIAREPK